MKPLDALMRDASESAACAAAGGMAPLSEHEAEVARQMQICNACRYCEGYCAVFPAMTRRLEFGKADIHYLSNLCHNCGACYHACQYAPPHDFDLNVPRAMARVRLETYAQYAWPHALGALYKRNGLAVVLAAGLGLAFLFVLAIASHGALPRDASAGNFYAIFPHQMIVLLFGAVFGFATLALALGVARFWRAISPGTAGAPAVREASRNALALTYLDGGHGDGCSEADDRFTLARRRFHHCTFYGFMLCFAATAVATAYHFLLQRHAPYALTSLPVVLGIAGGIGLLIGPAGLLWLNLRRDPNHGDPRQRPMDRAFIALLLLISASGFALLLGRNTGAMAALLALHLGLVMALFATLPYGKFAHGIFRSAALLKAAIEKRQPDSLRLGSE